MSQIKGDHNRVPRGYLSATKLLHDFKMYVSIKSSKHLTKYRIYQIKVLVTSKRKLQRRRHSSVKRRSIGTFLTNYINLSKSISVCS